MKTITTIIAFVFVLTAQAFASSPTGCEETESLYKEVIGLVHNEKAQSSMDLKDMAEITFTIDDQHKLHVNRVITKDYVLEYHIRQSLEGVEVHQCFEKGTTYTVLMNAKLI